MADDPSQTDDSTPPDAQSYLNASANTLTSAFGIGGVMDWLVNNGARWWAVNKATVIRSIVTVATELGKVFGVLMEGGDAIMGPIAVIVLSAIFGSDAGAAFSAGAANGRGLQDGAAAVGGEVLNAVFGPLGLDGSGTLEPGVERAEAYLGAITNMIMRGFIVDIASEMLPDFNFHFVAELEQELISGLGLGRVARTVLHPIITTLVADPALWALNLAYRPKLASPETIIGMWQRGAADDAELDDVLGRQGYGADHITALKYQHTKHTPIGDLEVLFAHLVLNDADAITRLRNAGYDEQSANEVWEAAKLRPFGPWALREAEVWLAKLEAGLVDEGTFETDVRALPLPPGLADLMVNVGQARIAAPRKQLSVAELVAAWQNNILTQTDVHDRLVRMGYSEDDATTLLLMELAIGKHKQEVADDRAKAQAARAAAVAQAKADRIAAAAAKAAAAAAARAAKATQLAQQRAQAKSDAEARREFVAQAAQQKQQLVAAQHAAAQLSSDQLAVANAQIAADTAALLAQIDGQVAAADATFAQQKLDLQTENRAADLTEALANVDLAAEADAQVRLAGVQLKLAANDAMLADKLGDLDTLYTDRAADVQTDLTNAQDAVDVTVLPTSDERAAAATTKQAALDATLQRKIADLTAEYDDKQAAADKEHSDGTITDKTYETRSDTIANSRAQATRAAQQSHDLASAGLSSAGGAGSATPIDAAANAKTKLQTSAQAALVKLTTDKVAAQLSAQQSHDKTALDLQVVQQQVGPITAAETARRKLALQQADDAATRNAAVLEAEIAKAQSDAAASLAKVQATAAAAHQRLTTLQSATAARESATQASLSATAALASSQEAAREALERTIAAHQPGVPAPAPSASA